MSGPEQGFGTGLGAPNAEQMNQKYGLALLGLVTLVKRLNFQAVIKSAASAASPTAWGAP